MTNETMRDADRPGNPLGHHEDRPGHGVQCHLRIVINASALGRSSHGYACSASGGHCVPDGHCDDRRAQNPTRPPDRPQPNPLTKAFADLGLNTPEPAPVANDSAPIWDLVIEDVRESLPDHASTDRLLADMRARDQLGREKYGTPLQANNGRDPLGDAYQEALDLCVYLRQAIEETSEPTVGLRWVYTRALKTARAISRMVPRGDS